MDEFVGMDLRVLNVFVSTDLRASDGAYLRDDFLVPSRQSWEDLWE